MKKYRIDGGRYGGEYTIGTVGADFVRYWQGKDQDDLIGHLMGLEWDESEDTDPNSPAIFDDEDEVYSGWYEIDDLEHATAADISGGFTVTDITNKNDYHYDENEIAVSGTFLLGREAYIVEEPDWDNIKEDDDYVAVLMFHSSEKGSFGSWFFETEEFDPNKLVYSVVETEFGEFVDRVWYDKVELECDYDHCDSTGKGYYACVGWMNKKFHDSWDKYDEELIEEYWDGLE